MIESHEDHQDLLERVEQVRRDHPGLQEQLDRYRTDRRSYDLARKQPAPRESPAAFEQRSVGPPSALQRGRGLGYHDTCTGRAGG